MTAALILVLGAAGYTIAQSTSSGAQGGMIRPGMGMMGGSMMGGVQGGMMMGTGMMSMMMGQPLTQGQLEQFAKQHALTPEQAKQMTDQCSQMMGSTPRTDAPKQ